MPEPSTSNPPNICWPVGGEIDIVEGFHPRGQENQPNHTSVYMTYHWAQECGKDLFDGNNGHYPPINDTKTNIDWTAWHTFAVEWSKDKIQWFIDGNPNRFLTFSKSFALKYISRLSGSNR